MIPLTTLLDALDLKPAGDNHFHARNAGEPRGVVFGGQILGQTIVAAAWAQPDKTVKTVHTIFARGAQIDAPLDIDVDPMHGGRTFGSVTVTVRQGGRLCARSLVLLHQPEDDLIRHGAGVPRVDAPDQTPIREYEFEGYQIGTVGGVDIADPDAVGPAILPVWVRFRDAPDNPLTSQALLAYTSDGFLIGTAMRPHAGVGQAQAHLTISTGVVSHTLTFHEPFSAGEWMLLDHEAPYAGHGRGYGRAHVFTAAGVHVASFVQDSMIRRIPGGQAGRTPERRAL